MSTLAKFFILRYEYVDGIVEKRAPFLDKHLELLSSAKKSGQLFMGGVLTDPQNGAIILFNVHDKKQVDDFALNDPFVTNDLVTNDLYSIREWTVVI